MVESLLVLEFFGVSMWRYEFILFYLFIFLYFCCFFFFGSLGKNGETIWRHVLIYFRRSTDAVLLARKINNNGYNWILMLMMMLNINDINVILIRNDLSGHRWCRSIHCIYYIAHSNREKSKVKMNLLIIPMIDRHHQCR